MHPTANESAQAATTKSGQTGPRTESGKANSSRNSIRTGLYAARDFIRTGEEEEYAQTLIRLMDELTPDGELETTFATEIMGATWRLRRCRLVEEAFGMVDDLEFDPMMDERTEKQQKSVDRARAQSHLILRRSIAELAKLQKARFLCDQSQNSSQPAPGPAPASTSTSAGFDTLMALADKQLAQRYRESEGLIPNQTDAKTRDPWSDSFCNPTPTAPAPAAVGPQPAPKTAPVSRNTPGRNAPCPCRSGLKFKKCCGNPAAGALNRAA